MTALLTWRHARRQDRRLLEGFVCTDPAKPRWDGKRLIHPKQWELDVQSYIRSIRPPAGADTVLYLGEDSDGLGAVILFSFMDPAWSEVVFRALAVSCRFRGAGGAHAQEALDTALGEMGGRAQAAGSTTQLVTARIHKSNLPSQRLCGSAGFTYVEDVDDQLQSWVLIADI